MSRTQIYLSLGVAAVLLLGAVAQASAHSRRTCVKIVARSCVYDGGIASQCLFNGKLACQGHNHGLIEGLSPADNTLANPSPRRKIRSGLKTRTPKPQTRRRAKRKIMY